MTAVVLRADARSLPLPDASVDLIVTSPPYFAVRSYNDGGECYRGQIGSEKTFRDWLAVMADCTREWMRVLKPAGSLFVNLGDKYNSSGGEQRKGAKRGRQRPGDKWERYREPRTSSRSFRDIPQSSLLGLPWRYALSCVDDLGLILRRDIVWHKTNVQPERLSDRCRSSHEPIFHMVKQPRYFAAPDAIKSPAGQMPESVWPIPSQPVIVPDWLGTLHFAAFPMELPRRAILGWSPPGGVVVDPFGGTGTTALVADVLGRTGITIDRSADYCRLARWRTSDPAERARAFQVPKPPPVPEGQGLLFGDAA